MFQLLLFLHRRPSCRPDQVAAQERPDVRWIPVFSCGIERKDTGQNHLAPLHFVLGCKIVAIPFNELCLDAPRRALAVKSTAISDEP